MASDQNIKELAAELRERANLSVGETYESVDRDLDEQAADALERTHARAGAAEAERERAKGFLSEGQQQTIESEMAWKRRAEAAEAKLRCPIGLDDTPDICSAGTCPNCLSQRLQASEARADTLGRADREDIAAWLIAHSYATGHGDSTVDLLGELESQARERALNKAAAYIATAPADTPRHKLAAAVRNLAQEGET